MRRVASHGRLGVYLALIASGGAAQAVAHDPTTHAVVVGCATLLSLVTVASAFFDVSPATQKRLDELSSKLERALTDLGGIE